MTRLYSTPEEHLKHFPKARKSTLALIPKRNATTEALRNKTRLDREPKPNAFIRILAWMWRK